MKSPVKPCTRLEAFLDGRLEGDERLRFETHLAGCDDCREEAKAWQTVKKEYASWVERVTGEGEENRRKIEPSRFAASLLESMEAEKRTPQAIKRRMLRRYHFAAAAAVLVGLAGVLTLMIDKRQSESNFRGAAEPPSRQLAILVTTIADGVKTNRVVEATEDCVIEAPKNGRVLATMGQDRFGLAGLGEIRVKEVTYEQTAIQLIRGKTAFSVSPRVRNARFKVTAGQVIVEVVGTRFSVAMDDKQIVTVCVEEGTVWVSAENQRIQLKAGSSITVRGGGASPPVPASEEEMAALIELLSEEIAATKDQNDEAAIRLSDSDISSFGKPPSVEPKEKPAKPGKALDAWRDLILGGEIQEAEKQIRAFLRVSPKDVDSLMLLATCQKRQNQYQDAVDTYKSIVMSGDERPANRARYLAAELSYAKLKDLRGAVVLLDDYLKHAPQSTPMRADARLMQAEALLGVGENVRAKRVLQEIVADYGRTPVANRARELLVELPGEMKNRE